jgi:hypothetical protein
MTHLSGIMPLTCGYTVGPVGLEPTTYGLKVRSSAIELETRQRPTPAGPKHQPA